MQNQPKISWFKVSKASSGKACTDGPPACSDMAFTQTSASGEETAPQQHDSAKVCSVDECSPHSCASAIARGKLMLNTHQGSAIKDQVLPLQHWRR